MNGDSDQHWNTLCLGIVAPAMATVGAAFFAGDVARADFSSDNLHIHILQFLKLAYLFLALLILIRLVFAASHAIFTSSLDLARDGTSKRAQTAYVYAEFTLIVVALVGVLLVDFFVGLSAALE